MTLSCTSIQEISQKLKVILEAKEFIGLLPMLKCLKVFVRKKDLFSDEEYSVLAGTSGSLVKVIEVRNCDSNCAIETLSILHILTLKSVGRGTRSTSCTKQLSSVISTIQKLCVGILREQYLPQSSFHRQDLLHVIASCLGILYNIVMYYPQETLGNFILGACLTFAFYGFDIKECIIDEAPIEDSILKSEDDSRTQKHYVNRNRRKRLRRKKAHPTPLPLFHSKADSFSGNRGGIKSTRVLKLSSITPTEESLALLSLKPQWMKSSVSTNVVSAASRPDNLMVPPSNFPRSDVNLEAQDTLSETVVESTHRSSTFIDRESTEKVSRINPARTCDCNEFGNNHSCWFCRSSEFLEDFVASGDIRGRLSESFVRKTALYTINAIVDKSGTMKKFGFWSTLMCQKVSLMTIVLRDPSSSVRISALHVISTFLEDSESFFRSASDDVGSPSFTSLGRQVGESVIELHRCLTRALLSERHSNILVKIMKTLELLLTNVRYCNLKSGLLTKVVSHVKYFLWYKEPLVRASAFSVMVCFLMIKPQVPEIKDLLMKYQTSAPESLFPDPSDEYHQSPYFSFTDEDEEEIVFDESDLEIGPLIDDGNFSSSGSTDESGLMCKGNSMVSWLVDRCVHSATVHPEMASVGFYCQVKFQALKVLRALVTEHFELISQNLDVVKNVISVCCCLPSVPPAIESSEAIKEKSSFASKEIVEEHSYFLLGSLLSSVKKQLEQNKLKCDHQILINVAEARQLWLWAFQGPLYFLLKLVDSFEASSKQSESKIVDHIQSPHKILERSPKLIASATDAISYLSLEVCLLLPDSILRHVLILSKLLVESEDPLLKLSAFRIVGTISYFSPIRDHILAPSLLWRTVECACDVLLSSRSTNTNKDRVGASSVLANIFSTFSLDGSSCDSFWERHEANQGNSSKKILMRFLSAGKISITEREKVQIHAIKFLGFALPTVPNVLVADVDVENEISDIVSKFVECLGNSTNLRVRSCSCIALGNILNSSNLSVETASWRGFVLLALSSLINSKELYRVQILVVSAFSKISSRELFGKEFNSLWNVLIKAITDHCSNIDFSDASQEIQNRMNLITQLCVSLCNMTRFLTLIDLDTIGEDFVLHLDVLQASIPRQLINLPPAQSSIIIQALGNVQELQQSDVLTSKQWSILHFLSSILSTS